ncbi:unnamed protein product [Urochloa humidicola]
MADHHAAVAAASSSSNAEDAAASDPRLLSVHWNQDSSCFTAVTTAGFRVFNCSPFHEWRLRRRVNGGGGYAIVEMAFRTNIFAVVAGGEAGRHGVELWDCDSGKRIHDVSGGGIRSAVRAVRVSRAHLAVVLDRAVRVYDIADPARPLWKIPTAPNPRGLCCLSWRHAAGDGASSSVLACPGTASGQVRVQDLVMGNERRTVPSWPRPASRAPSSGCSAPRMGLVCRRCEEGVAKLTYIASRCRRMCSGWPCAATKEPFMFSA